MSMLMGLLGQPRREPFTDWAAQIERRIERKTGQRVQLDRSPALRACYDVGLSPIDIAGDWEHFHNGRNQR